MLFVDIDDFKGVNDHHGHLVGDRLLREIGRTMVKTVGAGGFVTRLAGDEFIIVLHRADAATAETLAKTLRRAVSDAAIRIGNLRVSRRASMGMVTVAEGMSRTECMNLADDALLAAKRAGKNRLRRAARPASARAPSIEEVRLGLQGGQIGYHLQPILACADRRIAGYEALLRWERPSGEVLGPDQFLATMTAAYDAETRPPLEAARRVADWAVNQHDAYIAFNISEAFLARAAREGLSWVDEIVGDVPRSAIVFELVEDILTDRVDAVAEVVERLQAQGIRVALDDFGVAYSSLERLQSVPVDFVKIDRRFLRGAAGDARNRELLRGMIDIAHRLGAETVVEGVETEAQFEIVRAAGAAYAQGFHLGCPRPV